MALVENPAARLEPQGDEPNSRSLTLFHRDGPRERNLKPDTVRNILLREVMTPLADASPTPDHETGFRDGRLHSFRHYFCSVCANAGVPEQVLMQWLGHRQSAMVRHYYHLHDDEAQRQMTRLQFVDNAGGVDAVG